MADLENQILQFVGRQNYQPVKPRVIAKKLGIGRDDLADFKRMLKRLVKTGRLAYGASHLVLPVADGGHAVRAKAPPTEGSAGHAVRSEEMPEEVAEPHDGTVEASGTHSVPYGRSQPTRTISPRGRGDRISGVFRRAQAGFGFVRPTELSPQADRKLDIFIPADRTLDAASGDTVLVRLQRHRDVRRPNPVGEVIEVVERETHQFVGTYFEAGGNAYAQVDGTLFSRPILLGDPGAKNAQPDDKVVFEMVRFPTHYRDGEGVIVEVLGPRGDPGVDTLSIIREFNLPEHFADDVLDDARKQAEKFDEAIAGQRVDLTNETVITIDPIDARDFDDAISLERIEKGHWRLGVHIADVSHFVRAKSPLDREALHRGTSVYLPDRVLPMLPEIISNNLASLQPHKVRYTKTAFIEFTAEGQRVAVDVHSAAIKSRRRCTYEEVDQYLADREGWRSKLTSDVHALLGRMHELAMILRARRFGRGALELTMKEVKVDLDKDGRVSGAHVVENTESHQIIEEFMLAANEAVADLLHESSFLFLRRVHSDPDPRKLESLNEFVAELGLQSESLVSRFALQKLLARVAGKPEQHAVNYAVLRSLQRAIYSPAEEGHYALASDCYCHFTSPIRRYPDLTIHRLIDTYLHRKKPVNDMADLVRLGEHCSDREQRAEAAERELTKLKLLIYMSQRIGEEMDAVVTGVEDFGLFVQGINLPAEGLIRVSSLSDDFYNYDRKAHKLVGRRSGNSFRLGDVVRVSVSRVDVDRRELDFSLVERGGRRISRKADRRLRAKAKRPKRRR
ncbi:MAG TPA: ribonuclease R [Pirellulales bacterium]|nr:ribonuclease R [Pirellulales bacterium]